MADTGQVIGGYKLRGLLHTGRESQVWEVVEPTSNRHFAMKLLLPEFVAAKAERAKLFNDADIGKQLRHENVVNIIKVNKSPTQPHFIMEYFAAGSLRRRLQSKDPKDKEYLKVNAKKIFKQTATGLAYMNASGFAHLDVKPDNIVANAMAQTKIIDFAISKPIRKGFLANMFRQKGAPEGTPTYMSPEQIRTELMDGRSDIYSLGITWYEVVCGRPPFRGNSVADLYRKHFAEKPAAVGVQPGRDGRVRPAAPPDVGEEEGRPPGIVPQRAHRPPEGPSLQVAQGRRRRDEHGHDVKEQIHHESDE